MDLYTTTTMQCSKLITRYYSTSFTLGIKTLHHRFHLPVYSIYGFVRYADEIVDTFHDHNRAELLARFRRDTYLAIEEGISLNPVLHSFQLIVHQYQIEVELIDAFLHSMEMDLQKINYCDQRYQEYIYGSAEVVGLMCLKVFCEGDDVLYDQLKPAARSLGAAFQKVNFLRDINSDFAERGRVYFPDLEFHKFDAAAKYQIEQDIEQDFKLALAGIHALPKGARAGVYLAYVYYLKLFKRIRKMPASSVLKARVRVPDSQKFLILGKTLIMSKLNFLA